MASWILIRRRRSRCSPRSTSSHPIGPTLRTARSATPRTRAEVSDHNPDETGSVPIHDADHINEVHAIDVDSDLRTPGLTMEYVVQFILLRCRSGAEKRLRYIIYNRRIWEADNGWKQRAYTGASAHTEHAHFSFSYTTSLEASTVSWHLEDIPVTIPAAQMDQLLAAIRAPYSDTDKTALSETEAGHDVLSQQIPNGTKPGSPQDAAYNVIRDLGLALVSLQETVDQIAAKVSA
jgi:hypothetical protein